MAVVALKTSHINADGLVVYYGTNEAVATRAGQVAAQGDGRFVAEVSIALASLPTAASGNEQIVSDTVVIPSGAFIERVEVLVTKEPTTSGAPNLDLGLVDQDRTTEIDFNGFLAAADAFEAGTDLGAWVQYVKGTTEAGALIGTKLTNSGLITASADTADWTAGVINVRIYYRLPLSDDM